MRRSIAVKLISLGLVVLFALPQTSLAQISMDWTFIGDAGNLADEADGDWDTGGAQHFGAVDHTYNIGTYHVTNAQYAAFLNAKDPTGANALKLWEPDMAGLIGGLDVDSGGIDRDLSNNDGNKYTLVPGSEKHAVNFVSWYSAARFANWMNNGQSTGDTETGAYTLLHDGSPVPMPIPSNASTVSRNSGAIVFLPSEDEWYKAAYYNPATSSYYQYPTSSNEPPISSSPTALANHANYNLVYDGHPTDVGAYSGTTSPYGVFDMGGNLTQWNEAYRDDHFGAHRGYRGGSFFGITGLFSSQRNFDAAGNGSQISGFRIATVPEPSTLALSAIGALALALTATRRRIA